MRLTRGMKTSEGLTIFLAILVNIVAAILANYGVISNGVETTLATGTTAPALGWALYRTALKIVEAWVSAHMPVMLPAMIDHSVMPDTSAIPQQ